MFFLAYAASSPKTSKTGNARTISATRGKTDETSSVTRSRGEPNKVFKQELPSSVFTRTAQTDFYGTGNFQTLRAQDFSRDMGIVRSADVGSTVELRFGNGKRTYARKIASNTWRTDSGSALSDNFIASTAHDGGRVELNTMVKKK